MPVHKKKHLGVNVNMIPSTTMKIPLDFAWCLALCFIIAKGKSFDLQSAVYRRGQFFSGGLW
jgi:hypothetical protein